MVCPGAGGQVVSNCCPHSAAQTPSDADGPAPIEDRGDCIADVVEQVGFRLLLIGIVCQLYPLGLQRGGSSP